MFDNNHTRPSLQNSVFVMVIDIIPSIKEHNVLLQLVINDVIVFYEGNMATSSKQLHVLSILVGYIRDLIISSGLIKFIFLQYFNVIYYIFSNYLHLQCFQCDLLWISENNAAYPY
jgi:hypothetical protein